MAEKIKLIVGLGNPGAEYASTRHNAGFWMLEEIARQYHGELRKESKFHGEACKVNIAGQDCWLLKPTTYMNKSGLAVAAISNYFKIALEQMLVLHDELDLDAGQLRLKKGGGHAGHNGLRDIVSACGGKDFMRARIGVGHPGSKAKVVNYVLGSASREEQGAIDASIANALKYIEEIVKGNSQKVMNELNRLI